MNAVVIFNFVFLAFFVLAFAVLVCVVLRRYPRPCSPAPRSIGPQDRDPAPERDVEAGHHQDPLGAHHEARRDRLRVGCEGEQEHEGGMLLGLRSEQAKSRTSVYSACDSLFMPWTKQASDL